MIHMQWKVVVQVLERETEEEKGDGANEEERDRRKENEKDRKEMRLCGYTLSCMGKNIQLKRKRVQWKTNKTKQNKQTNNNNNKKNPVWSAL